MNEVLVVLCTCPNAEEAQRLAHALVNERLAACVNILPGVKSVYRWQGNVETESEVLLVIKAAKERFTLLRDRIAEIHSYDTPEIIAIPITAGSDKYLAWLTAQL